MANRILAELNVAHQCKKYGLSIWQCPQFLFLVMGIVIIIASLASYAIGTRLISDPYIVALIVMCLAAVLFIISVVIVNGFERLAEASRMKSEFINIVSHQLRSPITNIKWISDFLGSDEIKMPEEKRSEYLDNLKENIARMVELVDELLIVSRIEQGSFPIRKKDTSLPALIKELTERSKVFAEAKNIKIETYFEENLPLIYCDPALTKLVAENLIDNAIRYTRNDGSIKIRVTRDNSDLRFEIKDSGVGIPKSDQRLIFQKFFRSENALKEQTKGSGLGLYIAKSIIESSGGSIGFESEEGKGTTFYFIIPVH